MGRETVVRGVGVSATLAVLAIPVAGQDWRTATYSRQLDGSREIEVEVEYGAGHFTIVPIEEGLLYRMNLEYDEEKFEPVHEYSDEQLHIGIESIRRNINLRGRRAGSLDLELARGVPMTLDLEFGAVKAELELGGLSLRGLEVSTGASESRIEVSAPNPVSMDEARFEAGAAEFRVDGLGNLDAERIRVDAGVGAIVLGFDGEWRRDARVDIDMGLGSLELRVPEGLGVRLRKDSFLTALDSEGLIKRGDRYESLDYDTADYRVDIELDAAFGTVAVVWIADGR